MYKLFIRPIFFLISPEKVHYMALNLLKIAINFPLIGFLFKKQHTIIHPLLEKEVFGLKFKNPVGLAAGFDKDGKYFDQLEHLGFGFIEIGTVTPKAQNGNPKPRLFRLPKDKALINRMGFNNEGVEAMVSRLKNRKTSNVIIGGNIGKNKVTPNENAVEDYVISFKALFPYVDYFVVNVSSPNTPNLRALQNKAPLTKLLSTLKNLNETYGQPKPLLLKIAPDLNNDLLNDIIDIAAELQLDGLVASNTTISREGLATSAERIEQIGNGGLSGLPVRNRSTEIIKYIHEKTDGRLPIIAVGGIFNAKDAQEKLDAGASLVQIYTGFIYEGPGVVKKICKGLLNS